MSRPALNMARLLDPGVRGLTLAFLVAAGNGVMGAPRDFPIVPKDMEVSLYARDPLVRNPCAITFDAQGRLCIGMGPQYRNPKPDTPGDTVYILIDDDGDGRADRRQAFATGFNNIQGLAWKGSALWVANAPDLTVVRDTDGDDEADEYVRLYTDLGNLEHGLHGLNWGPDGRLYMSKGNSKGLTQPPDRVAPGPFRELWDVIAPSGTPDFPEPVRSGKEDYQKHYHDPADDWGRTGGILRCEEDGRGLEIVSRGYRNPWDIAFDDGFDFLGTDNDQNLGDKIFRPFFGADFGWGHAWSYDWEGTDHLPTVPASGPLFEGSGTGVIYCGLPQYPEQYRGVWLINDWLRRDVYIYRPHWQGALLTTQQKTFDVLAGAGGGRAMGQSSGRRFSPVDIELGPEGAIYISSWGRVYGARYQDGQFVNEGRIYRLWPKGVDVRHKAAPHRGKPIREWETADLMADLGSHVPVFRSDAQDELVRRGASVARTLASALVRTDLSRSQETWLLWTLGLMDNNLTQATSTEFFVRLALEAASLNRRIQSIRILGFRKDVPRSLGRLLEDTEPRIRFEMLLAMREAGDARWAEAIVERLTLEADRLVYYAAWGALRDLLDSRGKKALLSHDHAAVRRAALLALLEDDLLLNEDVELMAKDPDALTASLANKWLGGKSQAVIKGPSLNRAVAAAIPEETLPSLGVVRHVKASTGSDAEQGILRPHRRAYTDRHYRIEDIPEGMEGDLFIRTANNDAENGQDYRLTLDLTYPSTVYVADDVRGKQPPGWLVKDFQKTDLLLRTSDATHRLYEKAFPPGKVILGPNAEGATGSKSQYLVIVQPRILKPPLRTTRIQDVLPLLDRGNVDRGRDLFFSTRAANCSACHRLEGFGNVFAPDLSEIGTRLKPEMIVRSILEPSADITEGFTTHIFEMKDGDSFSGIIVEETRRGIKVADLAGQLAFLPKSRILKRTSPKISAMPATFGDSLSAQQVADLTAYLLTQKTASRP